MDLSQGVVELFLIFLIDGIDRLLGPGLGVFNGFNGNWLARLVQRIVGLGML